MDAIVTAYDLIARWPRPTAHFSVAGAPAGRG